jgi:deoxyadenosine/deoxycytidine kinase
VTTLLERFPYIVIEGPIGVGKTSLARKLGARLSAELVLEKADDNPFLERFYGDLQGYAFQTQLFFLFQRLKQLRGLAQPAMFSRGIVSDFLFAKDALFARMNLSDDEYRLYAQMYAPAAAQVPEPDLIIWLQASPGTLLRRIRRRSIRMEQGITQDYLQRLCDAYIAHFNSHDGAPLLAVVTEHFNPIEREADFELMLETLAGFNERRGILNPRPDASLTQPARFD